MMLNAITRKLPEKHHMGYFKSIRDDNNDKSLPGLSRWLFCQHLLIQKVTPAESEIAEPLNQRMSIYCNAATDDKQHQADRDAQKSKCPLSVTTTSHYLKLTATSSVL